MEVFHSVQEAQRFTLEQRATRQRVGVVPTMGALHEGHISLVAQSRSQGPTIATIFVNPTQFGPGEDLDKYPRTLDSDCKLLRDAGADAVFVPETKQMYPEGFSTYVDPPEVARSLEGVCRPDHFRGVTTVVLKLFQAIPASHAFFGKKDYQQLRVIESMVRDLNVGIEIVGCETVREADGLALSSRNRYLSPAERVRGLRISQALNGAEQSLRSGERRV
ncbi:MAG: pantoate--beta-alanine ligase, partial [Rubripirellula sp.]